MNEPKYSRNNRTVYHRVAHRVPYYRNYGVRVPITHEVPIYKDIPVPILMPEDAEDVVVNERISNLNMGSFSSSSSDSSDSSEECSECWNQRLQSSFTANGYGYN